MDRLTIVLMVMLSLMILIALPAHSNNKQTTGKHALNLITANNPYDPARDKYRPVIGGVQIEVKVGALTSYYCTSSFASVYTSDGSRGIVTAGHCSDFETGHSVRQPRWFWNKIGEVYSVSMESDSGFVKKKSEIAVEGFILNITFDQASSTYVGIKYPVVGYYSFDYIVERWDYFKDNYLLYKTGRTTGTTSGHLTRYMLTYTVPYAGTLEKVYLADIYVEAGDSGSPVYSLELDDPDEGYVIRTVGIISGAIYDSSNNFVSSIIVSTSSVIENLGVSIVYG